MSNGARVINVNRKCAGILYHKDALDELFFCQSWFFYCYAVSLNSLRNADSCFLQSTSCILVLWVELAKGYWSLGWGALPELDITETEQRVWFGSCKFCIFNSSERKCIVPSIPGYLPSLAFDAKSYEPFFLSDSHKCWLHIKIDLYFITDDKQALKVYLLSSQIPTGS